MLDDGCDGNEFISNKMEPSVGDFVSRSRRPPSLLLFVYEPQRKREKETRRREVFFKKKERKKQDIREELKMAICVEREREPTRECISRRPTVCLCVRVHIQEISFSPIYCIGITYIYLKTRRRRKKQQPQTK